MSLYSSWFDSDTLRQKLLRWVMLPMALLLLLNTALIYKFGHDSADRRHDRFLNDASKILLDQVRTHNGQVEFNIHSGALSLLTEDKKDQVFYSLSGWQQEFKFGNANLPLPTESLSENPIFYQADYAGKPMRLMAAIMPETDVASGHVVVLIGKTLLLRDERAQEWMWRILPSQLLLMVFAGIMVWWGVGRGLRPLLRVHDEVARRSSSDLSPLPEDQVFAEIRPLIHGFNELMGRLDESMILQRRFIADAAHQLRTPLTGLKAQAELGLRLDDPIEIRHSMLQMRHAADHAAHLANQLLLLARAEPNTEKHGSQVPLDLAALARNSTEYWVPKSLFKNIDLGFEDSEGDCRIIGNNLLLAEMLNNLIDNSLRYTPTGGQVTVRIRCINESVILEVEDNGPGVPAGEQQRVFERFYRVLGTNQDGCGLGLSIVREIADRHHAEVCLLAGAQGIGTLVRITFRAARMRLES
jgi:two-component system sensor histidine kinase TctE